MFHKAEIERHLKSYPERSADDADAVSTLEFFLRSNGRIHSNFYTNDKEPNIDGRLELISAPEMSRRPAQSFVVQIKGTNAPYAEKDGTVKYSLKSLAFPAYVYQEVTLDPGLLFVVLHAGKRGEERVFWKYLSAEFLHSIDFSRDSTTVCFTAEDELLNTEEGILRFCGALEDIAERHSFVKKLDDGEYSQKEIDDIIDACDEDITEYLEHFAEYQTTRDTLSRRILTRLNDLCVAALLLNSRKSGVEEPSIELAWEQALLNIKTKYLSSFYRMLKYAGSRTPAAGQAERLMLKYYDFMWQIRRDLRENYGIVILKNLENFPVKEIDKADADYYQSVARSISGMALSPNQLKETRYYIQKKTPFYVDGERYYEITLQLAGIYASKFNRLTVYTKENISSNYPIRIGYDEATIDLWGNDARIKVVTDWKVSIDPACLNKLAKILKKNTNIRSVNKEYSALMECFTRTGMSLLDLIDLQDDRFSRVMDKIYRSCMKQSYRDILLTLKEKYSQSSTTLGRNVVRYLLVRMREETLESVMPTKFDKKFLCDDLYVTSRCYPFEKNPYISDLAGSKTSGETFARDVAAAVGYDGIGEMSPYLRLKELVNQTREIYFEQDRLGAECDEASIRKFNDRLDNWECRQGYRIGEQDGFCYIQSYARDTVEILQSLCSRSESGNQGQKQLNSAFLKKFEADQGRHMEGLDDRLKIATLQNVFVNSKLLLIYGAAGTGKTTLINAISNLMGNRKKLFLTKTHAAKKNLQRRIDNPGPDSEFVSMDSFAKKIIPSDFDVVFVDECSTIDNRTMKAFLRKLDPNTLLVLAGDIYQIESIEFGNWFYYAKGLITTEGANVELLSTWRTKDGDLIGLWNEVRNRGALITEKLSYDGPYSKDIGPDILQETDDDEVVLCLNYDGKFGLNNINTYFQNKNHGEAVVWQEWTYKVGDKILFNDTKRFSVLYNNLKGKIVALKKEERSIQFTVDVETILTEADCRREELKFLGVEGDNTTRVMFTVYADDESKTGEERELSRKRSVVPFHLAYAVSIHKAQGLEYHSVKVIIPASNSEKITHGIFYTAITRAKAQLKIYWSPETMQDIIQRFRSEEKNNQSLELVKKQLKQI